jgi:hypothetical protein
MRHGRFRLQQPFPSQAGELFSLVRFLKRRASDHSDSIEQQKAAFS